MGFLSIPRMIVSSRDGWLELERQHPRLLSVIVFLVLPLSLLPPVMLYHAGTSFGDALIKGWSAKPWADIALMFLAGELIAFAVMGWLIKSVATTATAQISYHDAYLVAAVAPVPMWLSALALFVPNLAFNALVALTGLGAACALMYHGVYALCHMEDEVKAASVTHTVMAAGMVAWALLLVPLLLGN